MSAASLLQRLDRVKQTGPGRWLAKCPAHEDRSPSLSVRELDDGRVLIHDFGGCPPDAVMSAVGLQVSELFPERMPGSLHATRREPPLPARDILRAVSHEVHVAACAASDLHDGRLLSPVDRDRLGLAAQRLAAAVEVCNGSR